MFRNVLIGVDGTPTGRDAIALGTALAEPHARIMLANVHHSEMLVSRSSNFESDASERDSSRLLLEHERDALGLRAEMLSVSAPSVGRGLHTLAEAQAADLIVVGSCRRGLAGRVLLGDDTRAALNGAPCAVAIAPGGYGDQRGKFETIGVGYDFSGESHTALATAREISARHDSKLSLLNVIPPANWGYGLAPMPANWGDILLEARRGAERRMDELEGAESSAIDGLPAEELAAFGDRVDLLVVGSRNYGPLRRLVLGSTASRLARHARCPLLVLPRSAADASEVEADAESPAVIGVGIAT